MKKSFFTLIFCSISIVACKKEEKTLDTEIITSSESNITSNEEIPFFENKEAFFGETHVHTSASMDAFIGGNRMSTEDAYRFAKGEEVIANGSLHKIKRPLDFCAITDHSEYLGETYTLLNEGSPGYNDSIATQMREASNYDEAIGLFVKYVVTPNRTGKSPHPSFWQGPESIKSGWRTNYSATEKYYEPGKFTTLHAFEWSSAPNGGNLHRNVIFRDTIVPELPFSAIDGRDPEQLWDWMQKQIDIGSTVLAIPHNSNGSKGMMFPTVNLKGDSISLEYAQRRQAMEPLIEMMQIKGNSEVHPDFWPNDEFANFEIANSIQNYSGRTFEKKNFVRYGLELGLKFEEELGTNPFKHGFVGGTDNHNGTPSNVEEDNYVVGSHGYVDKTAIDRTKQIIDGWATAYDINPGSLTGVWAPRNTREDIWDAMKNKETFATSGPRLKIRLFAGYGYKETYTNYDDMVSDGYKKGVPMGGDLIIEKTDEAPKFLLWALKDPINANLDRIQIIKGWYENGEIKEKIFNVAASDDRINDNGSVNPTSAEVNLQNGKYDSNKGVLEFMVTWEDPEFNPNNKAFYYARVIMIPTARWNLWDEIREDVKFPEKAPKSIQERAWSSPIWFNPKLTN